MTPSSPISTPPSLKPEDIRAEFDLPSGKHVVIRKGKGKDLRLALMAAGASADAFTILNAIIARLGLFDGKRVTMESLDELDFDDAMALNAEVGKVIRPLGMSLKTVEESANEEPEKAEETVQ